MERGQTWRFRTRNPQLLYLGREQPGADIRQLFVVALDGAAPRQLTNEVQGVWDYAVHPQGEVIAYSLLREDGGTDLWRMDRDGSDQRLLLACPEAACLAPAWSPDGRQLAYERRDIQDDGPNLDPKAARIWHFDLEKGKEHPLFEYDVSLHSPVWSPVGERLAYVSPILPGVEVLDLQTSELTQFGNGWGAAPAWSPDGEHLVVADLAFAGEALVVRLLRLDLESEQGQDISGTEDFVKDVSPAWSPDGEWIAFGRQFQDEERWTPGRQLWLIRPDASESYPLLDVPMGDLFAFTWRPDGGALAYLQTDLSDGPQPVPDVSVWIYDFGQEKSVSVTSDAVHPKWLP
jgi:Tol biopolymer transport system component